MLLKIWIGNRFSQILSKNVFIDQKWTWVTFSRSHSIVLHEIFYGNGDWEMIKGRNFLPKNLYVNIKILCKLLYQLGNVSWEHRKLNFSFT